jgi:hypothetical protein
VPSVTARIASIMDPPALFPWKDLDGKYSIWNAETC